jgi:hypothetical protein
LPRLRGNLAAPLARHKHSARSAGRSILGLPSGGKCRRARSAVVRAAGLYTISGLRSCGGDHAIVRIHGTGAPGRRVGGQVGARTRAWRGQPERRLTSLSLPCTATTSPTSRLLPLSNRLHYVPLRNLPTRRSIERVSATRMLSFSARSAPISPVDAVCPLVAVFRLPNTSCQQKKNLGTHLNAYFINKKKNKHYTKKTGYIPQFFLYSSVHIPRF